MQGEGSADEVQHRGRIYQRGGNVAAALRD